MSAGLLLAALALSGQEARPAPPSAFAAEIHGLAGPVALAIDEAGRLHVVEELRCRVSVLTAEGERLASYGSGPGSGPGELRDPRGIALAPREAGGEAYVADTANHRVVVFDAEGRFARAFGGRGAREGLLFRPEALALELAGGRVRRVLVADRGNARLAVFDAEGGWLGAPSESWPAAARPGSPAALAFDSRGRAWLADELFHRVLRLGEDGPAGFVPELVLGAKGAGRGLFDGPAGLAAQGGRIFVCERENHRVQVLAEEDGRTLDEFGLHALLPGQGAGRLHFPEDLALEREGRFLALCEPLEDRLQRFERGEPAPLEALPADLGAHYGARLDAREGFVAVCDPARPSVLVYDLRSGEAIEIGRIGRHGTAFGALLAPVDAALLPGARALLVADEGAARLSRFELLNDQDGPLRYEPALGRFALSLDLARLSADERWTGEWPILPSALALEQDGTSWLLDGRSQRLLRFTPELELEAVHALELPEPESAWPCELALLPGARELAVVDAAGRRLAIVDREGRLRRTLELARPGTRSRPFGLHAAEDGALWLGDEGLDRIAILEPDGGLRASIGEPGFGRLGFRRPLGLAAAGGRVLVLDHGNHRVQVLDEQGAFVTAFGPRFFVLPALRGDPPAGEPAPAETRAR